MKTIKSPLISVITVCYNAESTIGSTILSVINQNFNNFEYIIVDGGSTDKTLEIIKKYKDDITIWVSESDKGIYDAMNKGLKIAKGEWSYFMNSGDYFKEFNLLSDVSKILTKTSCTVAVGKVEVFNNDMTASGYFPDFKDNIIQYTPRYLFNSHLCHQALFVKTNSYKKEGYFNLDYKVFSDFNTIYSIIDNYGGFEQMDLVIAKYNLDGVSANYKKAVGLFLESEDILKKYGDNSPRYLYYLRLIHFVLYYLKSFFLNMNR